MTAAEALAQFEPLVRARARWYAPRDLDWRDDLEQEARVAICERAPEYNDRLGRPEQFFPWLIEGAMSHAVRQPAALRRGEVRMVSLAAAEGIGAGDPAEEAVARAFWARVIRRARLTPGEATELARAARGEELRRSWPLERARLARGKIRVALAAM